MDLTKRKVLVTGAGGFIGSHLVEALVAKGCDVRALVHYRGDGRAGWLDGLTVRRRIEIVPGDARDRGQMDRAVEGCGVVFHLAALISIPYSYVAPESFVLTNVGGTLNLLEAARRHAVDRFVQTSTSEVYGTAQRVPMDETHPLAAQSPYAASKIAADQLALSYCRSFGLPVVVARPFNTYGPRQSARAVIPSIMRQTPGDGPIIVGNVRTSRDFTFVRDTVAGFIALAESDAAVGQVANLGTGEEAEIATLLRMLAPGREVRQENARMRPDASEVMRLCADASKARRLAGWSPQWSLMGGLRDTAEWFTANPGVYPEGHQI